MNHGLEETATLIGVPEGTLRRWLGKYVFPVGTLNDHNEWEFSDTDVSILKGMYETAQFGDHTAFVIKKQFRSLLRKRTKRTTPKRPKSDATGMRKRVQEMQAHWPEVPIRTLLWVIPAEREEFVRKVREGYLTCDSASKIVKLSHAHLRKRSDNAKHFPNTLHFTGTGKRVGMCLLHPDDVEKFRQFYTRPEGMLSVTEGAKYTGMSSSTLSNGLHEKTLVADTVADGYIKLFKKETLDAFKTFIRTRVRDTRPKTKRAAPLKQRRMDRISAPIAPPPKPKKSKKSKKTKKPRVTPMYTKVIGWHAAAKIAKRSGSWLRRHASYCGGAKNARGVWEFDRARLLEVATKRDLSSGCPSWTACMNTADALPPSLPPSLPPEHSTPRKLVLEGGRLVYVNAYGATEEAKFVMRVRKDRGVLIVVDAAGCEIDPDLRKTVAEALNLDIWWS